MGKAYPELPAQRELIGRVMKEEEDSFLRTLIKVSTCYQATWTNWRLRARLNLMVYRLSVCSTPMVSLLTWPNSSVGKTDIPLMRNNLMRKCRSKSPCPQCRTGGKQRLGGNQRWRTAVRGLRLYGIQLPHSALPQSDTEKEYILRTGTRQPPSMERWWTGWRPRCHRERRRNRQHHRHNAREQPEHPYRERVA